MLAELEGMRHDTKTAQLSKRAKKSPGRGVALIDNFTQKLKLKKSIAAASKDYSFNTQASHSLTQIDYNYNGDISHHLPSLNMSHQFAGAANLNTSKAGNLHEKK